MPGQLGFCLNEFNLLDQARQAFHIARQLDPADPIPILNEGIAALALGDYAAGWQGFEARWALPAYAKFKRDFSQPVWRGEDIEGKTLFLYAEQGFGDSIQMARYVPLLAARGIKVIVEVPAALTRLFQGLQGAAQIIAKSDPIPAFDLSCPLMSLPLAFATSVSAIPAGTPYLSADAARTDYWRERFPAGKKRVGLSWAGRASHENDRNRSLRLASLHPLLQGQDIAWVGLQRVIPEADKNAVAQQAGLALGEGFFDFAETAAAIGALDLVITVDTAVAHLAGALGKPVWVLLPFYADRRWLTQRDDSPWYPSARLFRQPQRGDWASVVRQAGAELKKSFS